jgi:hypothetical protein
MDNIASHFVKFRYKEENNFLFIMIIDLYTGMNTGTNDIKETKAEKILAERIQL